MRHQDGGHRQAPSTTTGPCHGRGVAQTDAAATASVHPTITQSGCVPATAVPSELPGAGGTDRRHATSTATRPVVTATTTPTAVDRGNARPCSTIASTTAATPNGPAVPSRITANARSGGP